MSPVDELLLVVLLLYLYESAFLLPRGAVAFTSWWGGRFRIREPSGLLGSARSGLLVPPLLPPLGTVHVCGHGGSKSPDPANGATREALRAALDVDAVRRDVERFAQSSGRLRLFCNLLFLLIFGFLPWLGHSRGLAAIWPGLLIALLALVAAIVATFTSLHRRLLPEQAAQRRKQAIMFALAPLEAVRALDAIARPLLAARHPVAVALALAEPAAARELARRELLAARYPAAAAAAVAGAEPWLIEELTAALTRHGVDVAALLAPPRRDSPQSLRYCPRCRSQYGGAITACGDCPGVALVAFDSAPPPPIPARP